MPAGCPAPRRCRAIPGLLALVPLGCGPTRSPANGEGTASAGGSTTAAESDDPTATGGGRSEETGSTDDSTDDATEPEPKYDIAPSLPRTGLCGELPRPDVCAPTWRPGETIGSGTSESWFTMTERGAAAVVLAGEQDTADGAVAWGLDFTMPCPDGTGAPKVDIVRFEVPAELTIALFYKFEYSQVGVYSAVVDVEYINACAHLRVHAIEIDPRPRQGEVRYAWPEVPSVGWAYVKSAG